MKRPPACADIYSRIPTEYERKSQRRIWARARQADCIERFACDRAGFAVKRENCRLLVVFPTAIPTERTAARTPSS